MTNYPPSPPPPGYGSQPGYDPPPGYGGGYGQPPGYGGGYGGGGYGGPEQRRHGGLATASLVLGIIGLILGVIPGVNFVAYPLVVLAIIFGIVAWPWGKAKAGLILGALGLLATIVWTVLFVVVIHHGVSREQQVLNCENRGNTVGYCQRRYG